MARTPIMGAGGIVVRGGPRPLIALVQRSKDDAWVLPKGKLKRKEAPIAAAEREVVEETGYKVEIHDLSRRDLLQGRAQAQAGRVLAHAGARKDRAQAD